MKPPQSPNRHDLAFLAWACRHGWRRFCGTAGVETWTFDDGLCPFKATRGMLLRLERAGYLRAVTPDYAVIGEEHFIIQPKTLLP